MPPKKNSIAIFLGAVYAYVILLTFLGPEFLGRDMRVTHDHDMQEAAGIEALEKAAQFEDERRSSGGVDEIYRA